MAVKRWENDRVQFFDNNGDPLDGGLVFFYLAGSSTRQNTYNSSAGTTPNSNPVVLDGFGRLPAEVWLTQGVMYKVVLAESGDGGPVVDPSAPYWTEDNVSGINDTTTVLDEWIAGPAPTFVSTTSFTLAGDQTSTFTKSRRLKIIDSGGTKYATITNSVFAALTTVTVAVDNGGVLANPISSVSYGIVNPASPSINADAIHKKGAAVVSAATTDIWAVAGDTVHVTGNTGPITSFGTAPYPGAKRTVIFDSNPQITHNATTLKCPGGYSLQTTAGMVVEVTADTTANTIITDATPATGDWWPFPEKHLSGLTYANNVADATNDIDIAVGSARDATNTKNIVLASAITKRLDAAWAVGTNQGGLDTGVIGNSDYFIWLITRSDTGVVDVLFSLSATAPTMPSNYDFKRLIGWFRRTAAAIVAFHAYELTGGGLEYRWDTPILDVDLATTLTTTARTDALSVPVGISTMALMNTAMAHSAVPNTVYQSCPDNTDVAASLTAAPLGSMTAIVANNAATAQTRVRTSATATIRSRATAASISTYRVTTLGFEWGRR